MTNRDGHVRVLPLHVANKIAAGEVVERPASVVKELVENAIDAGAGRIAITIVQGGRKLVAVQDDGCGMIRDDALLCLERQATSKIRDVNDIEEIDTLGFRGEAIPSIASVSRFTLTTRRAASDEGTAIQVNAGTLAGVEAAGCPPGTLVEVRDLFCNVPARRKFLRAYVTEENHVKQVFTVHALAHPSVGFSLTVDGREVYRLAPAAKLADRVRELFGTEFTENLIPLGGRCDGRSVEAKDISVTGFIERPNLSTPSRRDQYIFVNGRPATAPSIAYALREAYPQRAGDARPAAIVFIELPPNQVDVNVHPTKREVRFRDNVAVKNAIIAAVTRALAPSVLRPVEVPPASNEQPPESSLSRSSESSIGSVGSTSSIPISNNAASTPIDPHFQPQPQTQPPTPPPAPTPTPLEFAIEPDAQGSKPWRWFKYLAQSASGYLLIETDSGIVTVNPHAARERIAYEKMMDATRENRRRPTVQTLLIPEIVQLSPVESARIQQALPVIAEMGFDLEPFGRDTFKVEAIPQLLGGLSPAAMLATIAGDLADGGSRRSGDKWREELIAKSIARSFAGCPLQLNEAGAVKLVEELCACRMPYVCPRGKPVMIFTSTRELNRKFDRG